MGKDNNRQAAMADNEAMAKTRMGSRPRPRSLMPGWRR